MQSQQMGMLINRGNFAHTCLHCLCQQQVLSISTPGICPMHFHSKSLRLMNITCLMFVLLTPQKRKSIPAVFLPCRRLHVKVDCIYNSWRTSVWRQQQSLLRLRTVAHLFFSEEITFWVSTKVLYCIYWISLLYILTMHHHVLTLMVLRSIGCLIMSW